MSQLLEMVLVSGSLVARPWTQGYQTRVLRGRGNERGGPGRDGAALWAGGQAE